MYNTVSNFICMHFTFTDSHPIIYAIRPLFRCQLINVVEKKDNLPIIDIYRNNTSTRIILFHETDSTYIGVSC